MVLTLVLESRTSMPSGDATLRTHGGPQESDLP